MLLVSILGPAHSSMAISSGTNCPVCWIGSIEVIDLVWAIRYLRIISYVLAGIVAVLYVLYCL